MRIRTVWLAGLLSSGVAVAVLAGGASAQKTARDAHVSLTNGVTVSPQCEPAGTQHIAFSAASTHKFIGYGVNIEAAKAIANIPRTIEDVRKLGFVWVRTHPGHDEEGSGPDTEDSTDGGGSHGGANDTDGYARLYAALHAANIKVVNWLNRGDESLYNARPGKNDKESRKIKPEAIAQLAQQDANELRALAKRGLLPDLVELVNEPNLRGHKFRPEQYAQLLKAVETDLKSPPLAVNFAGPGTASRLPVGVEFVQAAQAQGALSGLKAITVHTYYVRDRPNNLGIPPANDPALQTLVQTANNLGIPVISSEYGGTDLKTKLSDPTRESVDSAEEFKATLDLINNGESSAFVWNLYPNDKRGGLLKTWALIDSNGPTNAYWPFYILARKIPVGAEVLKVEHADMTATMTSFGYAAFRSGKKVYVGLSNPAATPATVSVDLSRLGPLAMTHAAGFLPNRAVDMDASLRAETCPLSVTIPGGTGTVLDFDAVK